MRKEIIANLRPTINSYETVQHCITPDFCLFVHITIWPNVRPPADLGAFCDNRSRMNPRRIARPLIEKLEDLAEVHVRIGRAQRGQRRQGSLPVHSNPFFDEDGRGARRLQQREVPPIRQEGDLPRFGILNPGDSANLEVRRAFQPASQFLRNLSKFHGEGSSNCCVAFVGLSASLAQGKEGSTASQSDYSLKRRG